MNPEQVTEYEKAKRLAEDSKWRDAAAIFLDLRNQIDNDELSLWTARSLYNSEQYKLAYQVAAQSPQAFKNNLKLLVEIGLKAQHFISTRAMLLRQPQEKIEELLPLIEAAENQYEDEFKETIQNRLRSFYHLGDYPLAEQRKRLLVADQLPLQEFLIGAKFLLRDPFTQQFVKADILNILQQVRCPENVTMLCIDRKEHQVIPADLPTAYQNPIIIECQEILTDKLAQSDPQILRALQMQLDLQAILLNPLIKKIVTDPQEWVNVMYNRATTGEYSGENKDIIHWQQELNNLIDKLQ